MVAPYPAKSDGGVAIPFVRLADVEVTVRTRVEDLARVSAPLTEVLTLEFDGAEVALGLPNDELLLAALSGAIARAIGPGVVTVDVSVPGCSAVEAMPLRCSRAGRASPAEMLRDVRRGLDVVRQPGPADLSRSSAQVFFNDIGTPAGIPGPGHPLELRVYRVGGQVYLDWWYDTARFCPSTVEDLAAQFPLALIELTS